MLPVMRICRIDLQRCDLGTTSRVATQADPELGLFMHRWLFAIMRALMITLRGRTHAAKRVERPGVFVYYVYIYRDLGKEEFRPVPAPRTPFFTHHLVCLRPEP